MKITPILDDIPSPLETQPELPEDLLGFDVDDFLGLQQNQQPINELDLDALFSEVPFSPQFSNSDSGNESFSFIDNSSNGSPTEVSDENFTELSTSPVLDSGSESSKSPIITYAVIGNNSMNFQTINVPAVDGNFLVSHIEQPSQAEKPSCDVVVMNEEDEDDFDEFEDEVDPMAEHVLFSGDKNATLPTYITVCPSTKAGESTKLTIEEKDLLAKEGLVIPENVPLTKLEEKVLKKVRRKIRNKTSAQISRQKRKDYVKNLEHRVKKCTDSNLELQKKVARLEMQNSTLVKQLSNLNNLLGNKIPSYKGKTLQATSGTCLMMVVFSCCFLLFPNANPFNDSKLGVKKQVVSYEAASMNSRTLLSEPLTFLDDTKYSPYIPEDPPVIISDLDIPVESEISQANISDFGSPGKALDTLGNDSDVRDRIVVQMNSEVVSGGNFGKSADL